NVAIGTLDDDPWLVQEDHGAGTSGKVVAAAGGRIRVVAITGLFEACDVFRMVQGRLVLRVLDDGGGQVGTAIGPLGMDKAEQVAYVLGDLAQSQDQTDG